jgi:hypothetical protein
VRDEVKKLKVIVDRNGKKYLIAALNNKKPRIFEIDTK